MIISANNLVCSLVMGKHYAEAKALARKFIPRCRRALGTEADLTLALRLKYAEVLYCDENARRNDVTEAVAIIEDVVKTRRRVNGLKDPYTEEALAELKRARMTLEDVAAPAP